MRRAELARRDRTRVWHPYAPMPATAGPLVVESASGVRLRATGPGGAAHALVDGMSSWWAAMAAATAAAGAG